MLHSQTAFSITTAALFATKFYRASTLQTTIESNSNRGFPKNSPEEVSLVAELMATAVPSRVKGDYILTATSIAVGLDGHDVVM